MEYSSLSKSGLNGFPSAMKTDSVLRFNNFNPSSLPGGQFNRENKSNPTKSKHENINKTTLTQHNNTLPSKPIWIRREGEAGLNTWGRWQVDWEQLQHMMVVRSTERRRGKMQHPDHHKQHPTVLLNSLIALPRYRMCVNA